MKPVYLQNWEETVNSIQEQSKLMDAIHEKYPGKENRKIRDDLCKPHRDICVELHYHRIKLLIERKV